MSRYVFYKCLTLSFLAHLVLVVLGLGVSGDATSPSLEEGVELGKVLNVQIVDLLPDSRNQVSPLPPAQTERPKPSVKRAEHQVVEVKVETIKKLVKLQKPLTEPSSEAREKPVLPVEKSEQPILEEDSGRFGEVEKLKQDKESLDATVVYPMPLAEKLEATRQKDLFQLFTETEHQGKTSNLLASLSVPTEAEGGSSSGLLAESEKYRRFLAEVRFLLEKGKRYPWMARLKQLEGTIEVGFQITSEGLPHNVSVLTSSSHEILDDAALSIVKGVRRFPLPPGGSDVQLVLPLDFHLTK